MNHVSSDAIVRRLRHQIETDGLAEESDSRLLERFAAGQDEAAYAALVSRHGPMVLGVCRRVLSDRHLTEDVFQATFLVLARKAASIRKSASVASWLYGVAYRLAIRLRARTANREQRERIARTRPVIGPVEEASFREVLAILDEELSRLAECHRGPLVLCYLQGKTRDEAAGQLGLPLRTLQRRLEHARKLLAVRLRRRGLLASSLCLGLLARQATAAVPAALAEAAVSAGLGGPSSSTALALAAGLLQSMRIARWHAIAALVVMVGGALAGLGSAVWLLGTVMGGTPPADAQPQDVVLPRARPHPVQVPAPAQGKRLMPLVHGGSVLCVAVAPDGKSVAACSGEGDTTVRVWNAATGREVYHVDLKCGVRALAFSKGGHLAAGCEDRTIRVLETSTGKPLATLRGHTDSPPFKELYFAGQLLRGVSSLVFTDDAKTLISGGYDGTVRLWDVSAGKQLHVFKLSGHRVHRLALSSDGKTLAAGCEEVAGQGLAHHPVRLWNLASRQPIRPDLPRFKGIFSNGPVTALAFAPDGKRLAVGGFDSDITVWDATTGSPTGSYADGVLMIVRTLAFSPKGDRLAAGGSDGSVHLWDATTHKPLLQVIAHRAAVAGSPGVNSIAFTPDGRTLVSGGCDQRVRLWDVASGQERDLAK